MDQPVDMNEVKKCLKEANILDQDLPDHKMIEFYEAIKSSETPVNLAEKSLNESANELMEAIQNSESIAPSTSKKRRFSLDGNLSEDLKVSDDKEPILDATKAIFGFNDMPPMQPCPLKVMYYPTQYVNIHSSEKYLKADSENRINMWYEYHVKLNKLQCDMARMSHTMAPSCRPIVEDKEESIKDEFNDVIREEEKSPDELYVSRSGRHCKRKVYNESEDSDMELTSCVIKRVKDNDFAVKVEANNNLPEDDFDKLKKSKPQPKTYSEKKLNNEVIMSRSSLFRDTDLTTKSPRRTSKILNAAKEQMEVKKQEEQSEMLFNKSLYVDSDDSDIFEEAVTERRVVPPPLPKGAKRGKKKVNPLNITTTTPKVTESVQNGASGSGVKVNGYDSPSHTLRATRRLGNDSKPNTTSATSKAKKDVNMILCPLCSKSFPQKDIEDHASTCGEDAFPEPASKLQRITCEVCDAVVFFDTEYELHVRSCIAKQKMS